MEKYAGIWLDHRKAIIYTITGDTQARHVIYSGAQPRRRIAGEGRDFTRMGQAVIMPEHTQQERIKHQLDIYYHEILSFVKDATDIIVFGPGEAKKELEKVITSQRSMFDKLKLIESADRLTDRQIAARTREFTAKRREFRHPLNHPFIV